MSKWKDIATVEREDILPVISRIQRMISAVCGEHTFFEPLNPSDTSEPLEIRKIFEFLEVLQSLEAYIGHLKVLKRRDVRTFVEP